jgi:WD40 repeat protein
MVHRDVKPHNLMLTPDGQVKILDFGLSRFVSESAPPAGAPTTETEVPSEKETLDVPAADLIAEAGGEPLTRVGTVMGSPDYIAPEQIADPHAADIRADIYSLGCSLYHLLAGRPPFEGTVDQKLLAHKREQPRPIAQVRPEVPAALVAFLDRLLAKDPARRYQTPAEVAEALAPFAAAPRRRYWRWVALAAAVLLLVGGLVLWRTELGAALVRIATNKGELVLETEEPDVQVEVLQDDRQVQVVDLATSKNIALPAGQYGIQLLGDEDGIELSTNHFTLNRGGKQIVAVRRVPPENDAIGQVRAFAGHSGPVFTVAWSPHGRLALSSGADGTIRLWDVRTGKELRQLVGHQGGLVIGCRELAFLPDGRRALSLGRDKTARLWDVRSGNQLHKFTLPAESDHLLAASPDGRRAVSCGPDFVLRVWDLESGKEVSRLEGHTAAVESADFSPDGRRLFTGGRDWALRLWDVETGKEIRHVPPARVVPEWPRAVYTVAFAADGRHALSVAFRRGLRLYDLGTGELIRHFDQFPADANSGDVSADGRYVLSSEGEHWVDGKWRTMADSGMRLWDVRTGKQFRLGGVPLPLNWVAFSPRGRYALSAGRDGLVRLWRLPAADEMPERWQQTDVIRRFEGHTDQVWSVAVSPDGKKAVTASADKTARLWDVATGQELKCFTEHEDTVYCAAFSPDGQRIVSGSRDKTVRLWDTESGKQLQRFDERDEVWWVAFSPDGCSVLSAGKDTTIRLWDIKSGTEQQRFKGHTEPVRGVAFSPDGKRILSGSWDKTARLWDVQTGRQLRPFEGSTDDVHSVAFSPDGSLALSGGLGSATRLWDLETGRLLHQLPVNKVHGVAFAPDGRSVLTGGHDGIVRLWDVGTGRELHHFEGRTGAAWSVAYSPDGQFAFSAGWDGVARLLHIPDAILHTPEHEVRRLVAHPSAGGVCGVAFAPDGRAVSCGSDGCVRLWDVAGGKQLWVYDCQARGASVRRLAVAPDGRTALAAVDDHTVRVLDLATGKELRRFEGHRAMVQGVSFSSDGRLALSTSGTVDAKAEQANTMRLWEVATGKERRRFDGLTELVSTAVLSPDDRFILCASKDRTLRLWDARTGKEVRRFTGHEHWVESAVFSPDGRRALSGSADTTLRLWDVATGQELQRFEGHTNTVTSVAFSADGRRALSAGNDGTVRLWDVTTGEQLLQFKGHIEVVHAAVFSPEGQHVLSGGFDGTLRLWRLPEPAKPGK